MNVCETCGKEFSVSADIKSSRFCCEHCRRVYNGKQSVKTKMNNGVFTSPFLCPNGLYHKPRKVGGHKCIHCNMVFDTRRKLEEHKKVVHEFDKHNWNEGMTKDTHPSVAKAAKTIKNKYQNGELVSYWHKGDHLETRKKLSEKRRKYIVDHPETNPYVIRRNKENYAEKFFDDVFIRNKINFKREYLVDGYFLDFAFIQHKQYFEVDGEQHYWDQKQINHDIVRTKKLEDDGWCCIGRVRWSDFQKLDKEEKTKYINSIIEKIQK